MISTGTHSVFHLAAMSAGRPKPTPTSAIASISTGRAQCSTPAALLAPARAWCSPARSQSMAARCRRWSATTRALTPQTSYGTQKAIGELLVNDYSRKGFVDGRAVRLPTVVVRPGRPNRAASTFASSMIREPLAGRDAVCPVSPDTVMALASPRRIVAGLLHAHDLPADAFAASRSLQLPASPWRSARWPRRSAAPAARRPTRASVGSPIRRSSRSFPAGRKRSALRAPKRSAFPRYRHRRGDPGLYRGRPRDAEAAR